MRSNLFAYTETAPTDGYVGYVSLNKEEDGSVTMTVRSPGHGGSHVGCVTLPADVRARLGATLLRDELERLDSTAG
jgi:hypothetical protein